MQTVTCRSIYIDQKTGKPYQAGDIIKDPIYARTLQQISQDPMTFYKGSLAEDIVADIEERHGIITKEDLSSYMPIWKTPVACVLNESLTLYTVRPPSRYSTHQCTHLADKKYSISIYKFLYFA